MIFSITVFAENCNEIAIRLATDINNMHKKGSGVEDVRRRFSYNKDLSDLASLYMKALVDTKPSRGWKEWEYKEMGRRFADMACKKEN